MSETREDISWSENNGGPGSWRRSKCERRLCYVFAITILFLCFAGSATCLRFIFIFCSDCSNPSPLLLWINTAGGMLLFAIGVICVVCILLSRKRTQLAQNSRRAQVVVSEIPLEDLEKSPAPVLPCIHNHLSVQPTFDEFSSMDYFTLTAQRCSEVESSSEAELLDHDYLTTVRNINELNLSAFIETSSTDLPPDYFAIAQSINDVGWSSEELPDYCTAVQNINELTLSVEVREDPTEDALNTPPPCYEQALRMATLPVTAI